MSKLNGFFVSGYAKKIAAIRSSINRELDERQNVLEDLGFKVKRSEHLVNYEAALSLVALKDNVVLKATRFLRGGKELSIIVKHEGQETTLPLYPYKFEDALAIVNALAR